MLDLTHVFGEFPVLETERCVLRAVTPEDAADILRLRSDPRVLRYLGHPPMTSLEDAVQRVEMLRTTFQDQTGIPWAVASRREGRMIGMCSLWRLIKPHFRAEIGYELAPAWWGRGIMTEVVGAALTFGFATMGLHSVEAQMDPENAGSRRLLEKLGFEPEGYFRENYYDTTQARFTDTAVFSLLKARWRGRGSD